MDQPTFQTATAGPIDWRVELINHLLELQQDDGAWVGEARWRENDPVMITAYVVIALNEAVADIRQHREGE